MPDYPSDSSMTSPGSGEGDQILREIRIMLRYAVSEGLEFDDKARAAISAVQERPSPPSFENLMAAYSALAKVVAPATPASLEATEPAPGLFGFLRRPPLIRWMIIAALASAIGFIVTGAQIAPPLKETTTTPPKASAAFGLPALPTTLAAGRHEIIAAAATDARADSAAAATDARADSAVPAPLLKANWFFAAALGASFYGLFTAHEFVKNRTFDPRYNSLYLIRFVLGIVSGVILGMFAPAFSGNETFQKLGPSVIALLGGFSADAVNQVLQRFVDILLAVVRGDNSTAAKAKAQQTAQQELLALASDPALPAPIRDKVHESIRKLTQ